MNAKRESQTETSITLTEAAARLQRAVAIVDEASARSYPRERATPETAGAARRLNGLMSVTRSLLSKTSRIVRLTQRAETIMASRGE